MRERDEAVKASSPECEMMVLGSILNSDDNAKIGLKLVHEEDFYETKHKIIFKSIKKVFSEKSVVDVPLVSNHLDSSGTLNEVGGIGYLVELPQRAGTSAHIEAYCEDLRVLTRKRKLVSLNNMLGMSLKQDVDPAKILEMVKNQAKNIEGERTLASEIFDIQSYTLEDLKNDLARTKEGFKTGYTELDEIVRIPNEAITLVAGRPSHGKTTFMLNLFLNLIKQYPEQHFYFFSYEETRQQIAVKIINILSECLIKEAQNLIQLEGYLKGGSTFYKEIEAGKKQYQELVESGRLRITGEPYYVHELLPIIALLKSKVPVGAVFIDYIQKIKNKEKFATRQLELADTSNTILEIAKGCSLPIVLGAQLGRDMHCKDKVKLDNLREAGDLEQDANLVLGLFNPGMNKAQDEQIQFTDKTVDLHVTPLKNRNGPVNKTITLSFDRPLLKIKDKSKK